MKDRVAIITVLAEGGIGANTNNRWPSCLFLFYGVSPLGISFEYYIVALLTN
jgi:hypothetical protein